MSKALKIELEYFEKGKSKRIAIQIDRVMNWAQREHNKIQSEAFDVGEKWKQLKLKLDELAHKSQTHSMQSVEDYTLDQSKLKKQMDYANKIKSPAVILYGENEIKLGKPTLRNLSSGEERSIEIKELVNEIKKII